MTLDLVFRDSTSENEFTSKFFESIFETAIKELKLKNKIELSLSLVGEARIKELNKKYRNKNKVTDVLSFLILDMPPHKLLRYCATALQPIPLGDIFICLPFAKKQAKSENIDIEKKLAQLAVHGFLHLAGYDHEKTAKDAELMFSLERKILQRLRIE